MADATAVQFLEGIYQRTDHQIREILATVQGVAEVDTINVVVGDGHQVLETGIVGALRVDFAARITGGFLHEVDGIPGSATVSIDKAQYTIGSAPTFVPIVGSTPLVIIAGRYGQNEGLAGWDEYIDRGDVLRFSLTSVSAFTRLLIALRIRRLEP